jgi:hypothetical protein
MRRRSLTLLVGLLTAFTAVPQDAQAVTPTCLGVAATIVGTSGNDTLTGTAGADVIAGLGGMDVIKGVGGADRLCGGGANDSIYGGLGNDRLAGGTGDDQLHGGLGTDTVDGGPGLDLCAGESQVACDEFTEGNASGWAPFSSDAKPASVADDATHAKEGATSIRFETESGFDTGVKFPASANAHWDLTDQNYLVFWAYASNPNVNGFQGKQPVIVLRSPSGSYTYEPQKTYEPQSTVMYNRAWHLYHVPLSGDASWTRSAAGSPTLKDVSQLEIHQDTWDFGFTMYYDGLRFEHLTPPGLPPPGPPPPAGVDPNVVRPKVLLYVYDPIIESMGGQRMHEAYGWRDPVTLASELAGDLRKSSHGLVRYRIVDTKIVDAYPYFDDGYQYDDASFDSDWQAGTPHDAHFDYQRFVAENDLAARVQSGAIDEVWVYGFPYTGMWESTLVGDGGYWCNSGPVLGVPSSRLFVVMGLNYERDIQEALESYGHRVESMMVHTYGTWTQDQTTNWNRFTLREEDAPGLGAIGSIHYPVNSEFGYDYDNPRYVTSSADDWYNYPNFTGVTRSINAREWSPNHTNPEREYLNWWYDHLPHFAGRGTDDFLNNWWRYIVDPDQFKGWDGNLYFASGIPTVRTTAPAGGAHVSGIVTVRAAAEAEQDGALGRVDLYVDGAYAATDTLAPFTFRWDTAGSAGDHTLVTRAYELQNGSEAVSVPVTVHVP